MSRVGNPTLTLVMLAHLSSTLLIPLRRPTWLGPAAPWICFEGATGDAEGQEISPPTAKAKEPRLRLHSDKQLSSIEVSSAHPIGWAHLTYSAAEFSLKAARADGNSLDALLLTRARVSRHWEAVVAHLHLLYRRQEAGRCRHLHCRYHRRFSPRCSASTIS